MICESKSLILLVVSALLQGGFGQKFNFPEEVQYNETVGTNSLTHWASEGSVTITPSNFLFLKSTLVVSAVKELCTVDLTNCPPKNIPQSPQSCYCRAKTGDRYDVHVGSTTSSSLAGMTLQATVPGYGHLENISGLTVIGRLPDNSANRSQVTGSFTIDGGKPRWLHPSQNASVCLDTSVIVVICVGDRQPDVRLSIQVGNRVVVDTGSQCLKSIYELKAGGANVMKITYSKPNGCSQVSQIYFDEDSEACTPTATTPPKTATTELQLARTVAELAIPFRADLIDANTIIVEASAGKKRWAIDLVDDTNLLLHINVRPSSHVVRNSRIGQWGKEETGGGYPFKVDTPFQVKIEMMADHFEISVDGHFFADFKYRMADKTPQRIEIWGDIHPTRLSFEHSDI